MGRKYSNDHAYNKSDMVDVEIPKVQEDRVYLSAKKHVGIEELVEMIRSHIYKEYTKCEMLIPYDRDR